MPLLGFAKERLHPDLAFLVCLLVALGLMVAAYSLQVLLEKAACNRAAFFIVSAFLAQRAAGTPVTLSLVDVYLVRDIVVDPPQLCAIRTGVAVAAGIVQECARWKEW